MTTEFYLEMCKAIFSKSKKEDVIGNFSRPSRNV